MTEIRDFTLVGIPKGNAGQEISVEFNLDKNATLTIKAHVETANKPT